MQVGLIKSSFYFTYIFLITTGTICFIEALRNPNPQIRHIMNLETCISLVAGYFYGLFLNKLNQHEKEKENTGENKSQYNNHQYDNEHINEDIKEDIKEDKNKKDDKLVPYEKINDMRYTDWVISTPIMILVLCLVLGMENKKLVKFSKLMLILLFNFLMLLSGYLGEINKLSKNTALISGFIFFFAMYGTIWKTFMSKTKTIQSQIIYYLFLVLWGFYGIFYMTDKITKVVGYNVLDLIAKAFVGIFFWLYLTKTIVF